MHYHSTPGLEKEKKILLTLVTNNRLPHAMIFSGPEGCGKLPLALALIAHIQCDTPRPSGACGQCGSCQKTFKLIHPDVHFYFPKTSIPKTKDDQMQEKQAGILQKWRASVLENPYMTGHQWHQSISQENKLMNITANDCREMIRKFSLAVYEGRKKILLIWLPEYLGAEGNILLKLVEEPPEDSLILLVTDQIAWILPTLLSRCQQLPVPPFADADILTELKKKGELDAKALASIVPLAEGNMAEALQLIESQANPKVDRLLQWWRFCFKMNTEGMSQWVETIATEGREKQRDFLKFSLGFLDHILIYKATNQELDRFAPEQWKGIKGLAQQLSFDDMQQLMDLLSAHYQFIERNANPKILFMALSINIAQIFSNRKVHRFELI
jgi:DNA polymerase III subunit delta'